MAFYALDDRQPVMAAAGIGYAPGVMDLYARKFALRPGGFGAVEGFNGPAVWSMWTAGGKATVDAAKLIQAALNQVGYGPIAIDGVMGGSSLSAYCRFERENGVASLSKCWPQKVGVIKLGEVLAAGKSPGGVPIEFHKVGDEFVSGASPASIKAKAAQASAARLGVAVVVVAAGLIGLAYYSKKKRGSGASTTAVANRRRRRHRRSRR